MVAHYEYSPFGVQTIATGAYAVSNPFRFSSEYFDEETQLVYYNYRYYDPLLGHWLSRDPIGEDGGLNLYGMVGNNPLAFWDALGLEGGLPSTGTLFKRMLSSMFRGDNLLRAADNIAETFRPCDVAVRIAVEPYDWTRTLFDAYMGTATPLDFAGFLPFVPGGLGKGANLIGGGAARGETEVVQRWMSRKELEAIEKTGYLRGGRAGETYATNSANSSAKRAQQRLALPQRPEIRVTVEVPQGSFPPPTNVQPRYNMPGGGTERMTEGKVRVLKIIKIDGKP